MHNPFTRTAPAATTTDRPAGHGRRRRATPIIAGGLALGVLGAGAAVAADAHKTVRLDIDGKVREVSTWSGSVESVLAENNIVLDDRDIVAPSEAAPVFDGADVIVRYAREVVVSDGEETMEVWTTAVDASEVLDTMAARGDDVYLVASRSSERPEIGVRLPQGEPVNVFADGAVRTVPAGFSDVHEVVAAAGVELGELDRVSVKHLAGDGSELTEADGEGVVTVDVDRVEVVEKTSKKKLDFESVTKKDDTRYDDLPVVVKREGKKGVRTIVREVVLVDGEKESSEVVSDEVTREPVDEVKVRGTKERPAPEPVKTTPKKSTKSKKSSGSDDAPKDQGKAPSSGVWAKLAQCESGGRPSVVSSNGLYHGLYQFSVATWKSVGGSGLPSQASAAEQLKRAKILQARSGWGQWPYCSSKLGLR